ncbi:MAG: thioredoxin-like domain-containing protein [candidate division KSB1 bacterium]|nr:thioredoxin-like domain-containing protein [candidate division KSB1 bacterium]MDZ7276556.1 thioredoxin-like domain-containing protein [candidate division KSB1 bacterium]MDZ7285025.1 thioredoxin-like domain-containing protein [candidate division KSB1 bacterium]MDZ7298057.1 thioredoxin-like domain-containing protein [candidate division KSB1 bacterium]MDZ7307445.1 thioredoxin-like domain-containing protein [candidate division KSB1 bacterium]
MTPIRSAADRLALQSQIREKIREVRTRVKIKAPEFPAGAIWLNTSRPLTLAELRGKIVLLDFWTYCCINCLHVMSDLKYLEEKYAGRPFAVIGVHSAKFHNEKEAAHIRQAILRHDIEHPVVVDPDYTIWQSYTVRAWPTLILVDPEGYLLGVFSGEGNREILDNYIEVGLTVFQEEGKLDNTPLPVRLEQPEWPESLLSFPGKIVAEARTQRLVIADSGHHRLLVCRPDGTIQEIIGSGLAGSADGDFETAHFFRPQGMAWHGEDLIVCDTDNHLLRRVDFVGRSVTTIAGTGEQGGYGQRGGPGRKIALNSPWDIFIHGDTGYIAMAGPHQIWSIDLKTNRVEPFAGSGHEARRDGERLSAAFAQPSGITGEVIGNALLRLFIADSEISAVRQIDLRTDKVGTLAGGDLFQFGDQDGSGDNVRLQHPLGVCFHDGKIFLADTYNHKIKVLDPNLRLCKTLVGDGRPGLENGAAARFFEPSGLALLQGRLYVADTNNHAVRVVDLHTRQTTTLRLKPQALPVAEHLVMMGTPVQRLPEQTLQPGEATLRIRIILPPQTEFNQGAPLQILVRSRNQALRPPGNGVTLAPSQPEVTLPLQVAAAEQAAALRVELVYSYCDQAGGLCLMRQAVYEIPVAIAGTGGHQLELTDAPVAGRSPFDGESANHQVGAGL